MKFKTVLLCAIAILCAQASLTWCGPMPETTTQSPSNIPVEYQDAISKAFPGYQILNPSEILLNKKEMGVKLYNQVKGSPSLIVGKFNDDDIEDFAALIRNSKIKTNIGTMEGKVISKYDFYDGLLIVCYGLGGGKFDCTRIPGEFSEVHMPSDFALNKNGSGKYLCHTLRKIDLTKDREPYDNNYGERKNINIIVKTDVINYFRAKYAWANSKYIYQSKTALFECIESSH